MTLASIYALHPGLWSWVGRVFWSDGSCQDRGPKEITEGVRVDKTRLEPDDVNLQTKEIYCNYSVFIGSVE